LGGLGFGLGVNGLDRLGGLGFGLGGLGFGFGFNGVLVKVSVLVI
jgi:hypothetical protein